MRMFRVLVTIAMAATVSVVMAADAGAKASAAVCDKISLTEADLGQLGGKKFNARSFEKAANAFKSGATAAPGAVKRAMRTMASYYQKLAGANSANDAVTSLSPKDTEKYAKASIVWGTFIATNCA